jgi:hypothetical protein
LGVRDAHVDAQHLPWDTVGWYMVVWSIRSHLLSCALSLVRNGVAEIWLVERAMLQHTGMTGSCSFRGRVYARGAAAIKIIFSPKRSGMNHALPHGTGREPVLVSVSVVWLRIERMFISTRIS